ncbi:uncharacterized protein [Haliotis asinina]|uniref:uncharacterized protein n=1 Tax=Haliotis asinina TaxID=109174 RepID=UPI003532557F
MWTVGLLFCHLHCVFATGVTISSGTKYLSITENQNTWWDARRNCETEHERDLYIAYKEPLPSVLDGILNNNTFYWVGAMRYSTWIWTVDESPLYSYVGYSVPDSGAKTLSGNSVYACHLACKNKDRTFGLNGNKCYCLGKTYEATNTSAEEMQCPGNLDEKCGTGTGMSVYTLDAEYFEFKPTQHGVCGGSADDSDTVSIKLGHYRNCLTGKRRYACYQNRKNANGYEDYYPFLNSPIQMCLALKTRKLYWLPCSLHFASICEGISTSQVPNNANGAGEPDTQTGQYTGLGAGIGVLLLTVIAIVVFVRRQRKLRSERGDMNQQVEDNMPTDNASCGTDVLTDNGDYAVINPIGIDGQSSTPRATVNPSSHTKIPCKNYPVTDDEKDHNSLLAKVKGDAGVYDHTGWAEGHYDTARTGDGDRGLDESYSHMGTIEMGFEECAYNVANAGRVVKNLDNTYNHTYDTDGKTMDSCNSRSIASLYVGLGAGIGVFLIVIAVVVFVRRQRKTGLDKKEIYQQRSNNTSTENVTCSLDASTDYTYINPDALDGKPLSLPGLTVTRNTEKMSNPVPDVKKETSSKHTGILTGAPHNHLHDFDTTGVDERAITLGPNASAAVTSVASFEGVQYFVLENHSSTQEGKGDPGLYDHMKPANGLYNTT